MKYYTFAFYAKFQKEGRGCLPSVMVRMVDVSKQADPMAFASSHEEPGETFLNTVDFEA
ncbi:MAG TPA: hypothetical protein VJ549_00610 [Geothrix sp.]|nr:hypothetical protein [Geothrix sp.]HJV47749.1 hypothetical protein [Geothrix sp.]